MADEYTYLLAGVADTGRRMLTRGALFAPGVSVRRTSVTLPGTHGRIAAGPVLFDEPTLVLEYELTAPTWFELDQERAALMGLLARPGDLVVTRRVGAVDTTAACRVVSVSRADSDTAAPLTTVTVSLAIPAVFFRSAVATSTPITATTDVTAGEVDTLAGSSAPVVDAILRCAGPLTYIAVTDVVTGSGLSWSGALPAGEYVYLDAATLTAWRTATAGAWTTAGTVVTATLDYPPAGPLALWPALAGTDPTDREVRVGITGTGRGAETTVAVHAAPAHL